MNLRAKLASMIAAVSLVVSASVMAPTEAAAVPVVQPDVVVGQTLPIEKSAYFYHGRRFCFYPRGWHGPGFYLCGRPFLRGFFFAPGFRGWGGYRRGFRHHGFRHHGFRHHGFHHRGFRHHGFHHRGFRHHGFRHHGFHHHGFHHHGFRHHGFGHHGGFGRHGFGGHHHGFGGHHGGHHGGHRGHR